MPKETINFETPNGASTAYVCHPERSNGKAVIVIQEWWGLNAHIKDVADRYTNEGFLAIAPDLYRGVVATDADQASKLMHELAVEDGLGTIRSCVAAAAEKFGVSHFGVTGFCMGGTFALRAACEIDGLSAAVVFYGDIPEESTLKSLGVPTLFISGTKDAWINREKVAALEDAAERFELPLRSIKYEADHAFFNDTRPEVYDKTAAYDAWAIAVGFFNDRL
jgi:carboxymethylenebutenolidase